MDVVFGVHQFFSWLLFFPGFRSFPWTTWSPQQSLYPYVMPSRKKSKRPLKRCLKRISDGSRWSMAVQKRWWKPCRRLLEWKEKVDLETDSFSFFPSSYLGRKSRVYGAFEQFVLVQTAYGGAMAERLCMSCLFQSRLSLRYPSLPLDK